MALVIPDDVASDSLVRKQIDASFRWVPVAGDSVLYERFQGGYAPGRIDTHNAKLHLLTVTGVGERKESYDITSGEGGLVSYNVLFPLAMVSSGQKLDARNVRAGQRLWRLKTVTSTGSSGVTASKPISAPVRVTEVADATFLFKFENDMQGRVFGAEIKEIESGRFQPAPNDEKLLSRISKSPETNQFVASSVVELADDTLRPISASDADLRFLFPALSVSGSGVVSNTVETSTRVAKYSIEDILKLL